MATKKLDAEAGIFDGVDEPINDVVIDEDLANIALTYGSAYTRSNNTSESENLRPKNDYLVDRVLYFKNCKPGVVPYGKHKAIFSRLSKLQCGKAVYCNLHQNLGGGLTLDWGKKSSNFEISLLPSSPPVLRVLHRNGTLLSLVRVKTVELDRFAAELYLTMLYYVK